MGGNRIELLQDGPETAAALFAAIDAARDHINIESGLVEADGPGEELVQRLVARCRAGVKVNLLFDSLCAPAAAPDLFLRLRRAGLTLCERQPPPRWWQWLKPALPLRDPRQLMVVDGRIGFLGGVDGIKLCRPGSSPRNGDGTAPARTHEAAAGCRDLHVRVEGPLVQRLQRLFISRWQRHSFTSLPLARYHPPLPAVGTQRAALAAADTGHRRDPFHGALLAAIGSARESVWLTTAHRAPPPRMLRALVQAAERGVQVQLLLPGRTGFRLPLRAWRFHLARLLRAGVQIHERQDTQDSPLHGRICVIDGVWCSVGSSQADWRSVVHDAEARLVVLDERFAQQLAQVFRDDVAGARRIDGEDWARRPFWQRVPEMLAGRVESLL